MAPAFTTVAPRRTLGTHLTGSNMTQPSPQPAQPAAQPRKIEWSKEVRQYVQRCFALEAAIPGITTEMMQAKLKQVITSAAEHNKIDEIDWDTHPLPQQLILQERANPSQYWVPQPPVPTNVNSMQSENIHPGLNKKRRLEEGSNASSGSATPPWRKGGQNGSSGFEDRVTYASKHQADRIEKRQRKIQAEPVVSSKFQSELDKRRRRFDQDKAEKMSQTPWSRAREDEEPSGPVIGTSQKLEKNYFRLTSAPKPSEVRPLPILEQTLEFLKKKWRKEGNYVYICDQFKSLRQDLTVQHIKNSFTVDVYELHARIALEKGDLGEYNQCQTQLRALYSLSLGGHPAEFLAYRILYFIHTANRSGLNDILAEITPADKKKPAVKHALDTRSALALGNYHRFFRLYLDVPNMGAYLMDMFVVRERLAALSNICKA